MPHFSVEYSSNLEAKLDLEAVCLALHTAATECGMFPLGGIRVRLLRCEYYAVADLHSENGFMHVTASLGSGRSADAKKAAGEKIWTALTKAVKAEFASAHFALSMEFREIDPDLTWKKNTMHARL